MFGVEIKGDIMEGLGIPIVEIYLIRGHFDSIVHFLSLLQPTTSIIKNSNLCKRFSGLDNHNLFLLSRAR